MRTPRPELQAFVLLTVLPLIAACTEVTPAAVNHNARCRCSASTDEAEGRLERSQRALDLARNLAYAVLRADADRVITATLAEPGQVINTTTQRGS